MFRRFSDFERKYVVTFKDDPGTGGDPGAGGGGSGGTGGGAPPPSELQTLKDKVAALELEKAKWSSNQPDPNLSLGDKVKLLSDAQKAKAEEQKALESALTFNLTSADLLKQNEGLLPSEIADIFTAASKENFDGPVQKANATKAAIVQAFFSLQANADYLTDSQKVTLADYLKLTKNGKEEKAQSIYENLFEPALNTLKRVKKAEEILKSKSGHANVGQVDEDYKNRLISHSKRNYLGEK